MSVLGIHVVLWILQRRLALAILLLLSSEAGCFLSWIWSSQKAARDSSVVIFSLWCLNVVNMTQGVRRPSHPIFCIVVSKHGIAVGWVSILWEKIACLIVSLNFAWRKLHGFSSPVVLVFKSFLILSFMTIAETASTDCLTKDNFQSLLYAVYVCSCVYACMRVYVSKCVWVCVSMCQWLCMHECVCCIEWKYMWCIA